MNSVELLLKEQHEKAKRGEVNYADYMSGCPLYHAACDTVSACSNCRYFVPEPEPEELPADPGEVKCAHCAGENLSRIRDWEARTPLGTVDGLHERSAAGQWFRRVLCDDCGLVTDFKMQEAPAEIEEAARAKYAHPVREMHADLQTRVDDLARLVHILVEEILQK